MRHRFAPVKLNARIADKVRILGGVGGRRSVANPTTFDADTVRTTVISCFAAMLASAARHSGVNEPDV